MTLMARLPTRATATPPVTYLEQTTGIGIEMVEFSPAFPDHGAFLLTDVSIPVVRPCQNGASLVPERSAAGTENIRTRR
jgi:hypothetical protein